MNLSKLLLSLFQSPDCFHLSTSHFVFIEVLLLTLPSTEIVGAN